jgi:hypothetical protein
MTDQAIMNAVQAIQGGVLSRETLWENDLDIQDASQEKERIMKISYLMTRSSWTLRLSNVMWTR